MIQTHTQVLGIFGLYKRKHTIFEGWKEIWKLNMPRASLMPSRAAVKGDEIRQQLRLPKAGKDSHGRLPLAAALAD